LSPDDDSAVFTEVWLADSCLALANASRLLHMIHAWQVSDFVSQGMPMGEVAQKAKAKQKPWIVASRSLLRGLNLQFPQERCGKLTG
jgi:hypothetical protein